MTDIVRLMVIEAEEKSRMDLIFCTVGFLSNIAITVVTWEQIRVELAVVCSAVLSRSA